MQPQEVVWLDVRWAVQIATGGRAKVVRGNGAFARIGSSSECEIQLATGFPLLAGYIQFDQLSGWFIDFQLKNSPPKPTRISMATGGLPSITSSNGSYSIQILSLEPIEPASLSQESAERPLANSLCLTNGRLKDGEGNRIFKIPVGFSILGGSQNCHLRLRHRTVKEAHCLLIRSAKAGGSIRVIDLCAVPPVTICGAVPRGNLVRDGDVLKVGKMELAAKLLEVTPPVGEPTSTSSVQVDSVSTNKPSHEATAVEGVFASEADFLTASDRKIEPYTMSKRGPREIVTAADSRLEKLDMEFRKCTEALESFKSVISRLEQNQNAIQDQIIAIAELVKRPAVSTADGPTDLKHALPVASPEMVLETAMHQGTTGAVNSWGTTTVPVGPASSVNGTGRPVLEEEESRLSRSAEYEGEQEMFVSASHGRGTPGVFGEISIGAGNGRYLASSGEETRTELESIQRVSVLERFDDESGSESGAGFQAKTSLLVSEGREIELEEKNIYSPQGKSQYAVNPETVPEAMVLSTLMDLRTRDDVSARSQLAMLLSCLCVGIAMVMLFVWFTIPTGWRARFLQDLLSGFASG